MKRNTAAFAFSGSACLTVAALTACTAPEPVDLLLHSGTVLVLDEAGTTGTALAVRGRQGAGGRRRRIPRPLCSGARCGSGRTDRHARVQRRAHPHPRPGAAAHPARRDLLDRGTPGPGGGQGRRTRVGRMGHGLRLVGGRGPGTAAAAPGRPRRRRPAEPGHPDPGGWPQRGGVEPRAVARGCGPEHPAAGRRSHRARDPTAS